MKNKNKFVLILCLLLAILLAASSRLSYYLYTNDERKLENATQLLTQSILDFEDQFDLLSKNNKPTLFNFNSSATSITFPASSIVILYSNDEPVFWSNNHFAFPTVSVLKEQHAQILKYKNVWFYVCVHKYNDTTILAGLLPIKYSPDIKNEYIFDHFCNKNVSNLLDIIPPNSITNQTYIVKNKSGKTIFTLYKHFISPPYDTPWYFVIIDWALFIVCSICIYLVCILLLSKVSSIKSWIVLVISMIALLLICRSNLLLPNLHSSSFFDPSVFGSKIINTSLGVFAMNVWCVFLISIFFYIEVRFKILVLHPISKKTLYVIYLLLLYLFQFAFVYTCANLAMNSTIPLQLNDMQHINSYTIIVYVLYALISLIFVVFSVQLYVNIRKICTVSNRSFYLLNILLALFIAILLNSKKAEWVYYSVIPIVILWNMLVYYRFSKKRFVDGIFDIILIISFMAFFNTIYSGYYNTVKDRIRSQDRVRHLTDDRDYITEFSFTEIHCRVTEDPFLKRILKGSFPILSGTESQLINRIKQVYFKSYESKFDLECSVYDKNGLSIIKSDTSTSVAIKNEIDKYGYETSDFYLHFIEKNTEKSYYAALIPVFEDTSQIGQLAIVLKPKVNNDENVYPELLLSKKINASFDPPNTSYIVLNNNRIIRSKGSLPYQYTNQLVSIACSDTFIWKKDATREYILYKPLQSKAVAYAIDKTSIFQYITSYSYLLIIYILLLLFSFLLFGLYRALSNHTSITQLLSTINFQDKINSTLFGLLFLSFIAIASITTLIIKNQYETNNNNNLTRISIRINNKLQENLNSFNISNIQSQDVREELAYLIPRIANDEKTDINIYDSKGLLVQSSQNAVFEKGLQANLMNPIAFARLSNKVTNQFTQSESIGQLKYISLYTPLYNEKNMIIAYVNIPYFSHTNALKNEISRFLIALINVYIPILLITGLLALIISNSLTQPLNRISEQLRKIRLGKHNEIIEWNQQDEIGMLITEYNKMIYKLDESAQSLKRNEREGAWREMAKQIAHEIKNPLTPMKLSIQYLQRALQENNPNTPQLTQKVTHTLIEQIDNLAEIAGAFSSFAQMPTPNNEKMDIDHYLKSIIDLFSKNESIKINYQSYVTPAFIFADKNQMISLFNNLIKNAVQAISEVEYGLIDVYLLEEYGTIKIIIMDNGVGIPDENKDRIFTPNFTTKNSGSGLGLAISKQIIESTGGSIWFESTPNIGTSFYVVIPKYVHPIT